jgi:calcineurin-like phosphoesterase family protein
MKVFTSDLHESHLKITGYTNRGKDTTQENHTEWLIDVWNKNVTPADVCYSLGDYSFAKKYDDIAKFTERLNGNKILIKGNHDKREHLNQLVKDQLISAWYDYKEIKIGETSVCLFHFPVKFWHKQAHGSVHLHGHLHGANSGLDGKVLDVGIDSAYNLYGQHRFFTEEDILNYMKDKNNVESYHAKRTT